MPPNSRFDIVLLGHFARDRLVVDGRSTPASGGGAYYGSVALSRLGVNVAIITRPHPDSYSYLAELREAGVAVFATPADETSGIANYYDSADMERRTCKPLGFPGLSATGTSLACLLLCSPWSRSWPARSTWSN